MLIYIYIYSIYSVLCIIATKELKFSYLIKREFTSPFHPTRMTYVHVLLGLRWSFLQVLVNRILFRYNLMSKTWKIHLKCIDLKNICIWFQRPLLVYFTKTLLALWRNSVNDHIRICDLCFPLTLTTDPKVCQFQSSQNKANLVTFPVSDICDILLVRSVNYFYLAELNYFTLSQSIKASDSLGNF